MSRCDLCPYSAPLPWPERPFLYIGLYRHPTDTGFFEEAIMLAKDVIKNPAGEAHKFFIKDTRKRKNPWQFQAAIISELSEEIELYVLIGIGKTNLKADVIQRLLEKVKVPQQQGKRHKDYLQWTEAAVAELNDKNRAALVDWESERLDAYRFIQKLATEGRWSKSWKRDGSIPVYDMS
jgi:hypothetical protein